MPVDKDVADSVFAAFAGEIRVDIGMLEQKFLLESDAPGQRRTQNGSADTGSCQIHKFLGNALWGNRDRRQGGAGFPHKRTRTTF